MRVRSLRSLAVISACAMVPLACTSLLGDYTIGSAGPTDDASSGTDVVGQDVIATDTNPTDDAAESGPDAAGFAKLACAEVGSSRVLLGSFPASGGGNQPFVFSRPSDTIRVVAGDNQTTTHVYTFQRGGGSHNIQDAPLNTGHPMSVKAYSGGLIALYEGSVQLDGGMYVQTMLISKLPDGSLTWSAPVVVTDPGELDCANRLGATFQIINDSIDDYLVAFSYTPQTGSPCLGGNPRIFGRHIQGSGTGTSREWPIPDSATLDAGSNGLDFPSDGIVVSGTDVFVMATSGGGPVGGPTLFKTTLNMTSPTSSTFALKAPTDFMLPVAIAPGLASGTANLGFLEADVTSSTALPEMYVGQVAASTLPTLTPSAALATTTLAGINDIIVDKSVYHWNAFTSPGVSENLLGIAPTVDSHVGVNFIWWDASGRVRAQHTGAMNGLLKGEFVYGADITFTQPPFTILADFEMAFLKDDADASAAAIDVWSVDISCVKP